MRTRWRGISVPRQIGNSDTEIPPTFFSLRPLPQRLVGSILLQRRLTLGQVADGDAFGGVDDGGGRGGVGGGIDEDEAEGLLVGGTGGGVVFAPDLG